MATSPLGQLPAPIDNRSTHMHAFSPSLSLSLSLSLTLYRAHCPSCATLRPFAAAGPHAWSLPHAAVCLPHLLLLPLPTLSLFVCISLSPRRADGGPMAAGRPQQASSSDRRPFRPHADLSPLSPSPSLMPLSLLMPPSSLSLLLAPMPGHRPTLPSTAPHLPLRPLPPLSLSVCLSLPIEGPTVGPWPPDGRGQPVTV